MPATGGARSAEHSILPQGRAPTKVYDLDELRSRLEEERKAAAAHAGQVWFAGVDGRSVGPLTLAGLQGLEARGQLRRGTLVWRGGWLAWIPAQSVPELRPLLGLPELAPSGDPPALPEEAGFAGDGRSPEGGA